MKKGLRYDEGPKGNEPIKGGRDRLMALHCKNRTRLVFRYG
jgi:hypothetical protein